MARYEASGAQLTQGEFFAAVDETIRTERHLAAVCIALIGGTRALSAPERALAASAKHIEVPDETVAAMRAAIRAGQDPLGEAFSALRPASLRRASGAVYTPRPIVRSMLAWIGAQAAPGRIVDPGAGSGRFILAAGEAFPDAELIAIETDPAAALMLRAGSSARGWTARTTVLLEDYRDVTLSPFAGVTAFVGNPPYLRHHDIAEDRKHWYSTRFARLGMKASELAGLHLHFFLQTRLLAKSGDIGAFITSAEWLDVNYGSALRRLLTDELGGLSLHVLEPTVAAFPGTATTAAIACFRVGKTDAPVRVRSVAAPDQLNSLTDGFDVARDRLREEKRWSIIVRPSVPRGAGEIELGELFRVHRGQVTGANRIWIAGQPAATLPDRVQVAAVTKARDLIQAGASLRSSAGLRRVIDLPADLDDFVAAERRSIDAFLAWARARGAHEGYIARHRKAWWAVGLKHPAPILCTYMARRPPQFTLNACAARHINIAHGLYPREAMAPGVLANLVAWLNANIGMAGGRTYAGGLTKFEPKEVERLRVPRLAELPA